MRISVPGTFNGRARAWGFTLIEMLVVLMIMGLFVGLVSVIVQPDERAVLRLEADRLSELLDLAGTEARLTGKNIAWTADAAGYRFWRAGDNLDWLEIRGDEPLRSRLLPQGVGVSGLQIENMPARDAMRLEFTPQGSSLAFTVVLSSGVERYAIEGSPVGEVRVLPGTGNAAAAVPVR